MSRPGVTVAIPTHGNLTASRAIIEGCDALAAGSGAARRYVVVDDAPNDARPTAALIGAANAAVHYVGLRERAALGSMLVDAGCDRRLVSLALDGWPGLAPRIGASRNLLALVCPGITATVDDDVTPRMFAPPGRSSAPIAVSGDPSEFWFFRDAAEAEPFALPDADPIDALLSGLECPPTGGHRRAFASWLGMCGDPGSPNGLFWLVQHGESRARLMSDYAAFRDSRRMMRSVMHPTWCGGTGWTPAVVAYDHRRTLPPFLPSLRGQGLVWGACITAGGAGSVVRVPGALEHRLAAPRRVDDAEAVTAVASMATAVFLQMTLANFGPGDAVDEGGALLRVADRLAALAASESSFDAFATRLVETRSDAVARTLERALADHRREPRTWAADVDIAIAALAKTSRQAPTWAPYDLAPHDRPRALLRQIVAEFGELVRAWPGIVATARRLGDLLPPPLS